MESRAQEENATPVNTSRMCWSKPPSAATGTPATNRQAATPAHEPAPVVETTPAESPSQLPLLKHDGDGKESHAASAAENSMSKTQATPNRRNMNEEMQDCTDPFLSKTGKWGDDAIEDDLQRTQNAQHLAVEMTTSQKSHEPYDSFSSSLWSASSWSSRTAYSRRELDRDQRPNSHVVSCQNYMWTKDHSSSNDTLASPWNTSPLPAPIQPIRILKRDQDRKSATQEPQEKSTPTLPAQGIPIDPTEPAGNEAKQTKTTEISCDEKEKTKGHETQSRTLLEKNHIEKSKKGVPSRNHRAPSNITSAHTRKEKTSKNRVTMVYRPKKQSPATTTEETPFTPSPVQKGENPQQTQQAADILAKDNSHLRLQTSVVTPFEEKRRHIASA
ncbi:hypothetical protein AeNC1_013187 [Aphanomyces euteiches]|nr:hypothetical protein AeNC1_013187 [Aphanomyces euteiches]